jgi:hypothetical protein
MLAARADYMPSPVFQSCPALGEELGTLLDRCILLRMEDRPTADELHEALERLRVSVTEVAAPLRGECA